MPTASTGAKAARPTTAQMFGTSPYAIQQLNPGKIKNIDVIRAGDVIRVR